MGDVHHLQVAAKVCSALAEDLFQRYPNGIPFFSSDASTSAIIKEFNNAVEVFGRDYPADTFEVDSNTLSFTETLHRICFRVGRRNAAYFEDDVTMQFNLHCGRSNGLRPYSRNVCHRIEIRCESSRNDSHNTIELTTPDGWGEHDSVIPVELFMASLMVFVQKFEWVFKGIRTQLLTTV